MYSYFMMRWICHIIDLINLIFTEAKVNMTWPDLFTSSSYITVLLYDLTQIHCTYSGIFTSFNIDLILYMGLKFLELAWMIFATISHLLGEYHFLLIHMLSTLDQTKLFMSHLIIFHVCFFLKIEEFCHFRTILL